MGQSRLHLLAAGECFAVCWRASLILFHVHVCVQGANACDLTSAATFVQTAKP
jgi:hypothetical protein